MIGFFLHLFQLQALRNCANYLSPPPPPPTVLLISLFWIYSIRLFYTIRRRRIVQNIIEWSVIKTSCSYMFLLGQMVMVATASSLRSKCPALFKMRSLSVIMPMLLYPLFKIISRETR